MFFGKTREITVFKIILAFMNNLLTKIIFLIKLAYK